MEKKKTSRAMQAELTKKKIYKAGLELFREKGYQNVNVEQITKKAGVGVGTFYHYYASKMELLMETYLKPEDFLGCYQEMDLSGKSVSDVLRDYFKDYARMNENVGPELVGSLASYENRKFLDGNQDFENTVVEIIRYYQENGQLKKEDSPENICDVLFIAARGVMFDWAMRNGSYDLIEKTGYVMKRVLKAYLNE